MSNSSTTSALSLSTPPSQLKLPTYQITRASDLTLIYDPPIGSQELSDALSCHYPFLQGLQQKLQQASIDFLKSEKGRIAKPTFDLVTPISNSHIRTSQLSHSPPDLHRTPALFLSSDPPSHTNQAPQPTISAEDRPLKSQHYPFASIRPRPWNIKTGKACVRKPRGRKGGLEASERQRVAKNRGSACERHRKSRTKCHQSICLENKLNSCGYHRESNTECTFTCLDNLLVAKGIVIGEDDIVEEETSFQSTDLPAHCIYLGSARQAASPQLQHVQDPSIWDYQFLSLPGFDVPLPLGLESLEDSSNTQFGDYLSSPYTDQYGGSLTDSFSGGCSSSGFGSQHYGRFEDHLSRPHHFHVDSSIACDQIEQAAYVRGCIQGVGVTGSAVENYEHGSDPSASCNLDTDPSAMPYLSAVSSTRMRIK
ncbi:hypothetical protein V500_05156 [Pseudogymnoascus sp. VKM F-4518 (FW-2643)]|nr:hypothetical protein V500_05156 [Pseudogymnoascus sp. VKM F-4518 (FW-2643)]